MNNTTKSNSTPWPVILIVGALLFAWCIWPTPYHYIGNDTRVNRLTGEKQVHIKDSLWVNAENFDHLVNDLSR